MITAGSDQPAEIGGQPQTDPYPLTPNPYRRRLGRHVGIGTGLVKGLTRARAAGYDAAQVFPGNPTGWRHVPLLPEAAAAAREATADLDLAPLVIHAPYIINVATSDDALAEKSVAGVANALSRAGEIGARFVVVHAGSHKGLGEEVGIARVACAVERALPMAPSGVELLIENSAGSGNILAGTPAALGRLLGALPPEVGACIDTAHLWGSGVDLSTAGGVDCAVEDLERAVGLGRIRVLHVNDSAVDLDSRRDVHAHLGEGRIGLPGLAAWLTHPALLDMPVLLETPEETDPEHEAARCAIARLLMCGDHQAAASALAELAEALPLAGSSSRQ